MQRVITLMSKLHSKRSMRVLCLCLVLIGLAAGCDRSADPAAGEAPRVATAVNLGGQSRLQAIADLPADKRTVLCNRMADEHRLNGAARAKLEAVCAADGQTFLASYADVMADVPSGQPDGIAARPGCYCWQGSALYLVGWHWDFWTIVLGCIWMDSLPEWYGCAVLFP